MSKAPRKESTVLKKGIKTLIARSDQLKEARSNLAGLRAALKGYKADRVEATKALRIPAAALKAASNAVAKQERAVERAVAKVEKLAAEWLQRLNRVFYAG